MISPSSFSENQDLRSSHEFGYLPDRFQAPVRMWNVLRNHRKCDWVFRD